MSAAGDLYCSPQSGSTLSKQDGSGDVGPVDVGPGSGPVDVGSGPVNVGPGAGGVVFVDVGSLDDGGGPAGFPPYTGSLPSSCATEPELRGASPANGEVVDCGAGVPVRFVDTGVWVSVIAGRFSAPAGSVGCRTTLAAKATDPTSTSPTTAPTRAPARRPREARLGTGNTSSSTSPDVDSASTSVSGSVGAGRSAWYSGSSAISGRGSRAVWSPACTFGSFTAATRSASALLSEAVQVSAPSPSSAPDSRGACGSRPFSCARNQSRS